MSDRCATILLGPTSWSREIVPVLGEYADIETQHLTHGADILFDSPRQGADIIVIAPVLADMTGESFCRDYRARPERSESHLLLAVASTCPEAREHAYLAGADDVLTVPASPLEWKHRLEIARRNQWERKQARQEMEGLRGLTMNALSAAGELGHIFRFFRDSEAYSDLRELADAVLATLSQYGLHGVVQLRESERTITLNSQGRSSPIEQEMIGCLRDGRRMIDYGERILVDYPRASLLIRDMPVADSERYGRMRDNLCCLMECTDARVRGMADGKRIEAQSLGIRQAMTNLNRIIMDVDLLYKRQQSDLMSIFMQLNEEITGLFVHLGLTDVQEQALAEAAARANHAAQQLYDEGEAIDDSLRNLLAVLKQAESPVDR